MNTELIKELIDLLENFNTTPDKIGFNMETWGDDTPGFASQNDKGHSCGTSACIAGWVVTLDMPKTTIGRSYIKKIDNDMDLYNTSDFLKRLKIEGLTDYTRTDDYAMDRLGLEQWEANRLFIPSRHQWLDETEEFCIDFEDNMHKITPKHAAAVLRHLLETGEVNWWVGHELSPDLEVVEYQ